MENEAPKSITFPHFLKLYPNDDACLHEVFRRTHGKDHACPDCGKQTTWHKIEGRKCYKSACCGSEIYPMACTPLKDTKLPLTHWFFVLFMFSTSRNGVAAKEIQRQLGVSYPTALRMGRKVRELVNEAGEIVLNGTVEIDETLVGGKKRGGKRGWGADKPCVFGMIERDGKVITHVVPNRKAATLLPIIVNETTEDITAYTDEFLGYKNLHREVGYHQTVCHGQYQWVDGDCHTQSIEGYWGRLKRSIKGCYVKISREYMPLYLAEFTFRHNHRNENMFEAILDRFGTAA